MVGSGTATLPKEPPIRRDEPVMSPEEPNVLPEEKPLDFYISLNSVFAQLQPVPGACTLPPVRLLDSSWLLARAELIAAASTDAERAALALPHRQALEAQHPEAYLSVDEVTELETNLSTGALAAGAISHAWIQPHHPDPSGEQLLRLAALIRRAQRGELPRQKGDWSGDSHFLITPYHYFPAKVGLFYECAL